MKSPESEPGPIACTLPEAELRAWREQVQAEVKAGVVSIEELDDGYVYWFERTPERLAKLADFVWFESGCCAFLDFEIRVRSGDERISLRLTGPEGTKDFLRRTLSRSTG